tara:strand:+ start:1352 stop:1657 length:306 start_codon:yes stop_codon:yes gene_type:complete
MKFKKPAVCWQTDPDEAFFVGTRESIVSLANQLLELANGEFETSDIAGVKLLTPKRDESLTEFGLDVVVQGVSIVEKESDVISVVNEFRVLTGELPLVEGS